MARENRRHRSALRRIRPQRRAHGLLSSATGRGVLRRLFTEQVVMISRDYRQAIDWVAQRRFSILLFGNGARYLAGESARFADQCLRYRQHGKKAAHWAGRLHLGLARQVAAPQCFKSFYQLAAFARRTDGGSARRPASMTRLRVDISKSDLRPDGPTQRRREIYGDMEGGMDGRRADAKVVSQALAKSAMKP